MNNIEIDKELDRQLVEDIGIEYNKFAQNIYIKYCNRVEPAILRLKILQEINTHIIDKTITTLNSNHKSMCRKLDKILSKMDNEKVEAIEV